MVVWRGPSFPGIDDRLGGVARAKRDLRIGPAGSPLERVAERRRGEVSLGRRATVAPALARRALAAWLVGTGYRDPRWAGVGRPCVS